MKNSAISRAFLLTIGEELLVGDTINTNAAWIGSLLTRSGIPVLEALTVPDTQSAIVSALDRFLVPGSLVISTGGLGPTHDDITKITLLSYFGVGLKRDEVSLARNQEYFASRGIPFSTSNYGQSDVPENADVLQNHQGTAQGMWIEARGAVLVILPGVPREMKHLLADRVMPRLLAEGLIETATWIRYYKTTGIGESTLSDIVLAGLPQYLAEPGVSLAFLPQSMGVNLRIIGRAATPEQAEKRCAPLCRFIAEKAAPYIYSEVFEEGPVEALGKVLKQHGLTLAFAESCTGGLFSALNTDIPGSSAWLEGSVVTYSDSAKMRILGVKAETLAQFGAVSRETALAMVRGAVELFSATFIVSVTGVAGPDGGSEEKPVGTVWFALADRRLPDSPTYYAWKSVFGRDRKTNRERTVLLATEVVRRLLLNIPEMPFSVVLEEVD